MSTAQEGAAQAFGAEEARLFGALPVNDEDAMARLRARLAGAAEQDGLLDVAYRELATPVGSLLLAATEQGLVRVAYESQDHDRVLATLAELISPRMLRAPARLDPVARQLEEYFGGQRHRFDVPLDFRLAHGFRRSVLATCRTSATATPRATPRSPRPRAVRGRSARWARPAR